MTKFFQAGINDTVEGLNPLFLVKHNIRGRPEEYDVYLIYDDTERKLDLDESL